MPMDSRIVAREIKSQVWPFLRADGFEAFTAKTAWHCAPDQIRVVNFQSFNSSLAQSVHCTTFSFALNLGIYFRAIPCLHPGKNGVISDRPKEWQCHFRRRLSKTISQPVLPRQDTWYVDPEGRNLLEVAGDARTVLLRDGLPWFERLVSFEEVMRTLTEDDERSDTAFGFGTRGSPAWKFQIGHVARILGRREFADQMIHEAEAALAKIAELFRPPKRRKKKD